MKTRTTLYPPGRSSALREQAGVAMVELALVAIVFLAILIGIMEFGRWLFTLNAAVEATRWGARLAVVCGSPEEKIQSQVAVMLRSGGNLEITMSSATSEKLDYPTTTCITSDCMVTVKLVGAEFKPMIPYLGGSWPIPEFTTTLSRESLAVFPEGNPPVIPKNDICPP